MRTAHHHKLARLISIVFDPGVIFALGFLVLISAQNITGAMQGILVVSMHIFFIGIVWAWISRSRGDAVYLPRSERGAIYIAGVFASVACTIIFGSLIWSSEFWYSLSMVMMLFFASYYVVNRYLDKASLHIGMIAFMAMMLMDKVSMWWVLLLVSIPVLIWSRLDLREHEWLQIILGWGIGMVMGILTWLF